MMGNEDEILRRLDELSKMVDGGFKGMREAIADLEGRMERQEMKTRQTAHRQQLQASEIEGLKRIVRDLADSDAAWQRGGETAIRKEPAYEEFEEAGIGKRVAMRALRDAGAIKADSQNKTTCTIRIGGKAERVIIVLDAAGES